MQSLTLYGTIDQKSAEKLLYQISAAGNNPIKLTINSQGGSVHYGVTIYEALKAHRPGVDVEIVGWALSAASLVAMVGRKIRMSPTALMMVHAPWVQPPAGNASELRQIASSLDAVAQSMKAAYARTKQSSAVIESWLTGERWFTAEDAVNVGLADEIILAEAYAAAPLGVFACAFEIPPHLKEKILMPTQHQPAVQAAQTTILAAEKNRRESIRTEFAPFARVEGLAAVQAACEDDHTMTAEAAGQKILAHLAMQSSPVNHVHVDCVRGTYSGFSGNETSDFIAAATDAILGRAGLRVANPHPNAADLSRMRLCDMAQRMMSMRGESTAGLSPTRIIEAALTRSDLPKLLGGVGSRALRQAYKESPASHTLWTAEREVTDFRPQTLLQLSEAPGLEKVNEGAEYTNGFFSDADESFSIETFGRIISISRQAMVNDDLGAFTRLPAAFGSAARRMEADHVYAKLTGADVMGDGKVLFHVDHGNLGTAAELSVASLGAARTAMRRQRTLNGLGVIDLQPAFLIVPTCLETEAEILLASLSRPDAAHAGVANPNWVRNLTLVTDPRLDVNSETAWYLAADPNGFDTIIRAYLSGTARPELSEEEEFRRDAMSWKARLDFGVGVIDYRGLFKNPGA